MKAWKTLSRRRVLEQGRFLTVEYHEVELPDGRVIRDWAWLITPDYVNVMAETKDGRFLCFRQRKYAVDGESLAPVGGFIEPGEKPEAAARRELLEETGHTAEHWTALGSFAIDANRGAGRAYFFVARGVELTGQRTADDLEEQELLLLSRAEMEKGLAAGQFKVLAWAAVVAMGLKHLDQGG